MTYFTQIRRVELVVGGTTIKQGEIFTLGFHLIDSAGRIIVPEPEHTITVKVRNRYGLVYETTASVVDDHIEFTVDEDIGYGETDVELKVSDGDQLLQKYPAKGFIKLNITASLDNLEYTGVPSVTAEQMNMRIDESVAKSDQALTISQGVESRFEDVLAGAGDSNPEIVDARRGETTLGAKIDSVTDQLAETEKKALIDDFEYIELNYPPTPPNFAPIKPPFRVYRDVDNIVKHVHKFDLMEVGAGHIYVQGYGGSDSNNGLTNLTPVSTFGNAWTKANALTESVVVIHLMDNAYDDSRFSPYTFDLSKTIILKSESTSGRTFYHTGTRPTSITWVADGNAYKCSRTTAQKVYDTKYQNATNDLPLEYKKVNSVAEVQAEEGTWYTDGTEVWVRRIDDLAADKDVAITLQRGINLRFNIGDHKLITRGIQFHVLSNIDDALSIHSIGTSGEYWNENCTFSGSLSRNGLALLDVLKTFSFNSVVRDNYLDGINYHISTITTESRNYALEFECEGFDSGVEGVTNANASTAHDGYTVLRINGKYHDVYGPVIADVNGCFSVMYDCVAYNSLRPAGTAKAAFYADNSLAVKQGELWLINCAGGGFETDSIASYGIPVYIRKHKGRNFSGTGQISIV